jgi:hypothetical protein
VRCPITSAELVVENGTGSGTFDIGRVVQIEAKAPDVGMEFDKWISNNSELSIDNPKSMTTTVKIPRTKSVVKAVFILKRQDYRPEERQKFVNLAKDELHVEMEPDMQGSTFKIYTLSGQLVREFQGDKISTRGIPSNVYILQCPNGQRKRFAVVK